MKKLLGILVLGLFLITPSQADDIRDFQIEGMSVGDSALDYFSKGEINNLEIFSFPKSKKFFGLSVYKHSSFKVYDSVMFAYKKSDKTYKMYEVTGVIHYKNNIKECYKKKDEIVNEVAKLFKNTTKRSYTNIHPIDKSGKTKAQIVDFNFSSGEVVRVYCTDWSKKIEQKNNWWDELKVSINTKEFWDFINNEAY